MNLQIVVDRLSTHLDIDDWLVKASKINQTQLYLIGRGVESFRTVQNETIEVTIYNDHSGKRGSGKITVLPSDSATVLEDKLEQAIFMAKLVNNPAHRLPKPTAYPMVEIFDERDPKKGLKELKENLTKLIDKEKHIRLASAEFFISEIETALKNSQGIDATKMETQLFFDLVLVSSDSKNESEIHMDFRRRRINDLDLKEIIPRYAQYARDSLKTSLPRSGKYPVVLSFEVLRDIFHPFIVQSSGWAKYRDLSFLKKGEAVFGKRKVNGDLFTFASNGVIPYGTKTSPFDDDGVALSRVVLIKDGVLENFWATKEYADYLRIEPTGEFANAEVLPGVTPFSDLLVAGPLYHLVSFSSLEPDPITGNFVGEIRLGYEHSGGKIKPIKGGSVSGNIFDCFANARFSKETVFLGDYVGPQAIRFEELTVSGD